MRSFSKDELKNYNGRNEKPAYVGYKGLVYDVSESFHWKEGQHWVYHEAGLDLTAEMEHAPHFEDLLLRFDVVGYLIPAG